MGSKALAITRPFDRERVLLRITEVLMTLTGAKPAIKAGGESLEQDESLFSACLDSLSSVELRTVLQEEYNIKFSSTMVYQHGTLRKLTDYVMDMLALKAD